MSHHWCSRAKVSEDTGLHSLIWPLTGRLPFSESLTLSASSVQEGVGLDGG